MIRVLELIFSPDKAWQKIATSGRGATWALLFAMLPSLAIGTLAEGYGLVRWGQRNGELGHSMHVSADLALKYELTHVVLGIVMVLLSARFLHSIGLSFNVHAPFSRTLATVAYAVTPIFLMRIPDAIPGLPTWICYGIGALLTISSLYHGVAVMMQPEQTKGFGLFIISMILVVVFSGVAHFCAVQVLNEHLLANVHLLRSA